MRVHEADRVPMADPGRRPTEEARDADLGDADLGDADLREAAPAGAISGRAVTHGPHSLAPGDTLGRDGTDPDAAEVADGAGSR